MSEDRQLSEWRRGWSLVFVSMIGGLVASLHVYSLGVLIGPIEREFGWPRAQITAGLIGYSIITIIFAPMAGMLIDRFGSRRVGIPGMILFCSALALFSAATHTVWIWWGYWLVIAFVATLIKPALWAKAIAGRFEAQRGLALSVMLCGSGVSSTIVPPIAEVLSQQFDWRGAYIGMACVAAVVILPLMFLFLREGEPGDNTRRAERRLQQGLSFKRSVVSWEFARLGLTAILLTAATLGLIINFVPITTSLGLPRPTAIATGTAIGIASIVGRLISGFMLDRWSGPAIGAISCILPIGGVLMLLWGGSEWPWALAAGVAFGLALGAESDILAYLTTRYFGLANYAAIFGLVTGLIALGQGIGPTLGGAVYDLTGGYTVFLWCIMPVFVLAASCVGTLGPYPERTQDSERREHGAPGTAAS